MRNMRFTLAALLVFGPLIAHADFIEGAITMSGDFVPTGGTNLGDATGIDFIGDDFVVDGVTGTFAIAGIGAGDIGFLQDFQFNPLNPGTTDPLWAIGGFTFSLETISIVFQNSFFLVLEGSGHLSFAGFNDTPGTWTLTANSATGAGGALFNFSAGSAASPVAVPEPGTLALLGIGLLGMGLARRRKNA